MTRMRVLLLSVALLAAGYVLEQRSLTYREPTAPLDPSREDMPAGDRARSMTVDSPFQVDVSEMLAVLDGLRADERSEQIADWAVYGTLQQAGLSTDDLRHATFNILPARLPAFEEVVDFEYGRGRRVFLPDGQVWLFYSATDDQKRATLARLADRVRMERGESPDRFSVFRYRSALVEGRIYVEREPDISAAQLFSADYGYVQQQVATAAQLGAWLDRIDDVTHVAIVDGKLVLGGRRIEGARTASVDIEDVAALYQAHRRLATVSKEVDQALDAAGAPIEAAFSELVDAYNANVDRYNRNNLAPLDTERFGAAVQTLSARLTVDPPTGLYSQIDRQKAVVASLKLEAGRRIEQVQRARFKELLISGAIPPDAPGFSLDPQWDVKGLAADLTRLLRAPNAFVAEAQAISFTADATDASARPRRITTAHDIVTAFDDMNGRAYRVPARWRPAIEGILAAIRNKSGREVEERAIVPFLQLKKDLSRAEDPESDRLLAILEHIESTHRTQCARYDGDIKGTRVGMNLFYTDLLAKLWASIDYYREAPINAVYGFRSSPIEGPYLEPLYWDEQWEFPSTRLWFGTKGEAYKGEPDADTGLNFANIATRVYSAGSNPLVPGDETTAAEESRRVFGWWDRHYAQVADFEQAYHVQNQIMKWSVITGWMAKHDELEDLEEVQVDRSHRFDRWYQENADLKFREFIPFLPENQWLGGTECIEILRSYMFPSAGYPYTYIEGGVSLGSSRTLNTVSHITDDVPLYLRRGAIDYSTSTGSALTNLRGTKFTLPTLKADRAAVIAEVPSRARLRTGTAEISTKSLTTEITREAEAVQINLTMEGGSIDTLAVRRTAEGVRLQWSPGDVEVDRATLRRVADRVADEQTAASGLAADTRLLPTRGNYVVESANGRAEALRLAGSGGGAGAPPRGLRAGLPPDEPRGDAYLRTTDDPFLWAYAARRGVDVRGERSVAAAFTVDAADANTRLNAVGWQRLRPLTSQSPDTPGAVERVFTAHGPGAGARPVAVQTHDAELGELRGFVYEDALYLERPANPALSQKFNDFVLNEGVSGRYLANAIETGVARLDPAQSVSSLRGMRAALQAADGNYSAALAELRLAAEARQLPEAMGAYQRQLQAFVVARLTEGEMSPAAALFARRGGVAGESADVKLLAALDALKHRHPEDAAKLVQDAAAAGKLSDDSARVSESFGRYGSNDATNYVRARSSGDGLPPELAQQVQLEVIGTRLHTRLKTAELGAGRRLPPNVQADLAQIFRHEPPEDVYVQDSKLLNKLDWDGTPGPTLNRVAADPDIAIVIVSDKTTKGFRPSVLIDDGGGRFIHRSIGQDSARPSFPALRPAIFLVYSCDEDDDGTVDEQERRHCHDDSDRAA